MASAEKLPPTTSHEVEKLSGPSAVIRRIIHLALEIEQTCGYGKSYTCGGIKEGGYSHREWEAKIRQDQQWEDTNFKWKKERRPLIAELQMLTALHRAEFPELADLVEKKPWERQMFKEVEWAEIGKIALAVAQRMKQPNDPPSGMSLPKMWEPPLGYVGRKTICTLEKFRKNGKNPAATTIDGWVKSAAKESQPVAIEKDPANQENYYPETWILERIATWNPRPSET